MTKRRTRRWWLKNMAAGAGLVGASRVFPAPFLLADPSPNSKLAAAVIGCGGRGVASLTAALGEKLVAIVDVDDGRLAAVGKKASESGAKPRAFFDYRR